MASFSMISGQSATSEGKGRPPLPGRPQAFPPPGGQPGLVSPNNNLPPSGQNCCICLPVDIEICVDIRSRQRAGMQGDTCEIDGRIDVTGTSQTVQPLSALKDMLKRQRDMLAGLTSSGHRSISYRKNTKDSRSTIRSNAGEIYDTEAEDKRLKRKAHLCNSKSFRSKLFSSKTYTKRQESRGRGCGGIGSTHQSFRNEYDEVIESSRDEENKKRKRLKAGTNDDDFGIPEDIKTAAMLKGTEMCQKTHKTQLVELYNRRRKRAGKDIGRIKTQSTIRMRSEMSLLKADAKNLIKKLGVLGNISLMDKLKDNENEYEQIKSVENIMKNSSNLIEIGGQRLRGGCEKQVYNLNEQQQQQPVDIHSFTIRATSRLRGGMEKTMDKCPMGQWNLYGCRCECSKNGLYQNDNRIRKESKFNLINEFNPALMRDVMHMEGYNLSPIIKRSKYKFIETPKYKSAKLLEAMKTLCEKSTEISTSESSDIEENGFFFYGRQPQDGKSDLNEIDTGDELCGENDGGNNRPIQCHMEPRTATNLFREKSMNNRGCTGYHHQKSEPINASTILRNQLDDQWKFNSSCSKIKRRQKSKPCTCCSNKKLIFNHVLMHHARKSQISIDLINNLGNSVEIDYYKNTIKRQSNLHKSRKIIDPLETLQKVNEKLLKLTSMAVKSNHANDSKMLSLNQNCNCCQQQQQQQQQQHQHQHQRHQQQQQSLSSNYAKIKRRKTRRYYETQRKRRNYAQLCGETTEYNSNIEYTKSSSVARY